MATKKKPSTKKKTLDNTLTTPEPIVGINQVENDKKQEADTNWYAVGALIVVGLVAVVGYYMVLGPGSIKDERIVADVVVVKERDQDAFSIEEFEATEDDIGVYLETLEEELNKPSLSEEERNTLLYRKAFALMNVVGDRTKENRGTAAWIVQDFYNSENELYRAVSIPMYLHLLRAYAYHPSLNEFLPSTYKQRYTLNMRDGASAYAATLLAYHALAREDVGKPYEQDRALVTERAFTAALYLSAFGGDDAESVTMLEHLNDDLSANNVLFLEPVLLKGAVRGEVHPAIVHAFAYDVAQTFGKGRVSEDVNRKIDATYLDALSLINSIPDVSDERKNLFKRDLLVMYVDSLYRRYGAPDEILVRTAVGGLFEAVTYNEITTEHFRKYLTEGKTAALGWIPFRSNLYEHAEKYPPLGVLLEMYSSE